MAAWKAPTTRARMAGPQGYKSYGSPARSARIFHQEYLLRGSNGLNALGICWFEIPPRQLQIVMGLKIHPELRTIAKVQTEPKRRVSRDASPVVDDLSNAVRRNTDSLCELVLRQTILGEEFFFQHFARRDRCKFILCH